MNKVCELYYKACLNYGFTPIIDEHIPGFWFKLGNQRYLFRGTHTPFNDVASASVTANKYCTNRLLHEAGLPVPPADVISKNKPHESFEVFSQLHFPLVIKPAWDTACGEDVTCNIKDLATLNHLLEDVYERHECISVEEYQPNLRSYRVLVFFDAVIGIVERIPAHVIGDATHNIKELIELQNLERQKHKDILPLGDIKIMPETEIIFKERGINATYVPLQDEKIPIRYICNSTYGGEVIGVPLSSICKENAKLLCQAAKVLNLNIVGFDFICTDISVPYQQSQGFIIEANASPDISINENAIVGTPTPVSETILKKFVQKHWLSYLFYRLNTGFPAMIVRIVLLLLLTLLGFKYYVFS